MSKHRNSLGGSCLTSAYYHTTTTFLFLKKNVCNFGAEAERSYIFLRFEAENVLEMFLNYMVYTISADQCGRDQEKGIRLLALN